LALLRLLTAIALVLLPVSGWAATIALPVGGQRILDLPAAVTRIVIALPGIVEATVLNERQVQVVALRPGHTGMTLFTDGGGEGIAYDVQVAGEDRPTPAAAPATTGGGGGVNVRSALRGQPDLGGVRFSGDGEGGVLSGTAPSLEAHARAAGIAAAGGGKVADLTRVGGGQMVAVEIRFAAVSVNTMKALGFNFQALGHGIQGALTSPGGASGLNFAPGAGLSLPATLPLQGAFNLFLAGSKGSALGMVSVLSSAGLMQLLAEPTLMVRSGDQASFLAGGDIPIPVPQSGSGNGSVTIQYHPYGVRLEIAPVVLSSGRILLRVSPEVSEIDNANALTFQGYSVPAFRRRSTSTTVELGNGQSFMLAGLIYNNDSFTETKVPWLGDLPILGNFFKFTQNSHERQELIVIATPHLVGPLDGRQIPPLPGDATRDYNPSFGDIVLNAKPLDSVVRAYGLAR
jgi:pilus assembly protein CpaC